MTLKKRQLSLVNTDLCGLLTVMYDHVTFTRPNMDFF